MANSSFVVTKEPFHSVAFRVYKNSSTGYLEVSQWVEGDEQREESFGRAVYSLRSNTDVVNFCNILIASGLIRAKRKEE